MSSMRETVLRYEGPPRISCTGGFGEKWFHTQQLKNREHINFVRRLDEEKLVCEKARLLAVSELKITKKRMDRCGNQCDEETRQAAAATVMIRRRSLELQLERDMGSYNGELAAVGKTFHTERL